MRTGNRPVGQGRAGLRLALAGLVLMSIATVSVGALPASEAGAITPAATWTQQSPATSPPARSDASMAYDPATGNMVLFGGYNGGYLNDTWTWDGTTWTQQSPATSPPVRFIASMAYDPATGNMVLFGGADNGGYRNDTWTWDGTTWTQQSPATSPPVRAAASMAYDPATGDMVLFGGAGNGGDLNDTWTWDGTTWTQQSPATSPPVRAAASMAYDAATGNMVLFGGYNGGYLNDTWTYAALVRPTPTVSISNLPASDTYGNTYNATVTTTGDGATSVTSSTPLVCTVSGTTVTYVTVGTCTLVAHVATGTNYGAADGSAQSFVVNPIAPVITSFSPASGPVGTVVTIIGTHLSGVTLVTIHDAVPATIVKDTATKLKIIIPTGASTGRIKVFTPGEKVPTATVFTVT